VRISSLNGKKLTTYSSAQWIILIFLGILFVRLWYLQIFQGAKYRKFAEHNRITRIWLSAPRGIIFDRNLQKIAANRSSFSLTLTPYYVKNLNKTLTYLDKNLKLEDFKLVNLTEEIKQANKYRPFTLIYNLSLENLVTIEINKLNELMSGIDVVTNPVRDYIFEDKFSHFTGYLGEINKEELKQKKEEREESNYRLGSLIGRYGIEKKYEEFLKGVDGIKPAEVDAMGRIRRSELISEFFSSDMERSPVNGVNVVSTIDADLQQVAYNSFNQNESGSIIAMDPTNGDVLILLSYPGFNPQHFTPRIPSREWSRLNKDPLKPLMDKTLKGQYPPGSTYKIIIALAGLQEKVIDPNTTFKCTGKMKFGNRVYACHKEHGHGIVNLKYGIIQSCDIYFYNVGLRLGVDKIAKYAKMFDLGNLTGIGINDEKRGLIPTSEWKLRTKREPWQGGETLSIAVGQGFNLLTPIQLASMISTVANGGTVYKPNTLKKVIDDEGKLIYEEQPTIKSKIDIDPNILNTIKEALLGVTVDPKGTAYWTAKSTITNIAGKTGTAQVMALSKDKKQIRKEWEFQDHALFVAYAPAEKPEIAVAVVVEHGGHGTTAAAPKAKKIIETFMEKYHPKNKE
jgi:penicillin-binding protein 2